MPFSLPGLLPLLQIGRPMYYFLITGGRGFNDATRIQHSLNHILGYVGGAKNMTMINGRCPQGADQLCYEWAQKAGVKVLEYPADWHDEGWYQPSRGLKYDRGAGPKRNQVMVDKLVELGGVDVFAFFDKPESESRGTADCVRRARKANLQIGKIFLNEEDATWHQ